MAKLIGRDRPAAALRAAVERVVSSHGSLVLVAGEAGIGKSALVASAAEYAVLAGARVLGAACWEGEGAPGYWPWVQVARLLRPGVPLRGETAFELYDTVTGLLVTASREQPVVVVLEDLHWADAASLRLLEFVVRHAWFERLLIIGTYRDDETELRLEAKAGTLTLTGLAREEVGRLVADTTGLTPDERLVTEIHRRTGGNPFFVEQTAHLWQGGTPLATIPPGVRAAVRRRLSRLPATVLDVLRTAAVLGREFEYGVLTTAAGRDVATALDQAISAKLVTSLEAGRSVFVHDLVRETLYTELDEADARARHAAALRALDHALPAERARHACLAAAPEALGLLLAAAKDAEGRFAEEEAAGHYRRALDLVPATERHRRVELLLDLGVTQHGAGDTEGARRTLEAAVAAARELDDQDLLALAALKLYSAGYADFVHETHQRLVRADSIRLDEAARELSELAAERARHGEDDQRLGFSLLARVSAIWRPGTATERLAITGELSDVARRGQDVQLELNARSWRAGTLLELGDPRCLAEHRAFLSLAERAGLPLFEHEAMVSKATFATLAGRFDEALPYIEAAFELGEQPGVRKEDLRWMQRWSAELLRGRAGEVDAVLAEMARGGSPHFRLCGRVTAVHRGDASAAVRHLAEIMAHGEQYLRWMAPLWLRFQAQAAALSKDPVLCERARAAIAPYLGQWALTATVMVDGPFAHWAAVLDAAQERWDDAVDGFTAAYRAADRLNARPWSIESRARLAEALLARGDDAAAALIEEVARDAAEIDMLVRLPPRGGNVFRLDGAVWTLSFAGRTVHLPDSKGLGDLRVLLDRPSRDVSAVELLNPSGGRMVVAAKSMGGDAVLDEEAKRRYRRRLESLDDEIDSAAVRGDGRRAAELNAERQALLAELRAAAGLGGRTRTLGDEAERARKAVTNRIRNTLRLLDERHPELAGHLRASVSTGSTCRYQPATEIAWA